MEVAEEDAQGVADAAVGFGGLLKKFFGKGDFVEVVDGADPKTDEVGAVFVVIMVGGHGLGVFVAALIGFGDFFAGGVDHKAVGDDGFVRGAATGGDADHQGALEPAAMLVGGFDVEVGRGVESLVAFEHGDAGAAGIDPNVEGVLTATGVVGEVEKLSPLGVGFGEPGVGAEFFDDVGCLADDVLVEDGHAVRVVEHRKRHTPGALAADAPIGTRFDGAVDAVATPGGKPCDVVDFGESLLADGVDLDEELRNGAEDDRRFGAPAVGILMFVVVTGEQGAFFLEQGDDRLVGFEDVDAHEIGKADFIGVETFVVDRREDFEAVGESGLIVIRAVAGGDVDLAGAGFGGDEQGIDHLGGARQERVLGFVTGEVLAFELGEGGAEGESVFGLEFVDERFGNDEFLGGTFSIGEGADEIIEVGVERDTEVGGKGPGRGGPDDEGGIGGKFRGVHQVEFYIDGGGGFVFVFDFGLGQSSAGAVAPDDGAFGAVDEVLFNEFGEGADDVGFVAGVEREVGMVPVAKNAEAFEAGALDVDVFAGVFFGFLADLDGAESVAFFHHAEFDGEAVAVPAGHERHVMAEHGFRFGDEILEDFVERGAHVDVAVGKRGSVVENEGGFASGLLLDLLIKAVFFPFGESLRFALGEGGAHGEVGHREVKRVFIGVGGWLFFGAHDEEKKEREG